jgi:hypothetical protein
MVVVVAGVEVVVIAAIAASTEANCLFTKFWTSLLISDNPPKSFNLIGSLIPEYNLRAWSLLG